MFGPIRDRHVHHDAASARGSSARCRGAATASVSPRTCCCCGAGSSGASSRSCRSRGCRASRCTRVPIDRMLRIASAHGHVVVGPGLDAALRDRSRRGAAALRRRRARHRAGRHRAIDRIAGPRMTASADGSRALGETVADRAGCCGSALGTRSCRLPLDPRRGATGGRSAARPVPHRSAPRDPRRPPRSGDHRRGTRRARHRLGARGRGSRARRHHARLG